jgi:PhnB protein
MRINTYLNFPGNCEQAFTAYAKILGGTIIAMMMAGLLMGSDALPARYLAPQGFSVNVDVDTPAEADRIYAALAEGGAQTMPIAETFWARRFGMCVDRFGTPWMVNCEKGSN